MNERLVVRTAAELDRPLVIGREAYTSRDYARAERKRLFHKVWLQAGRLEDLPAVGDYLTFAVAEDSVIVLRDDNGLRAFHNVCPHRGRRLVDVPPGQRSARGHRRGFVCGYHGWSFDLAGRNTYAPHEDDWQGCLGKRADLGAVAVDTWGGWIWLNLDGEAGPLRDYLEPAAT
ncbi:MAG TPA: Rieske (2Fe-2S) protein, partial [Reyranella sp.]|nr:Rieske (2Fe-2S) protein [Reyranella sp.]